MTNDIKILDTQEFEVEMYHQTIEVCAVASENFGWVALVECPHDPQEKIRVLLDLPKMSTQCIIHETVHVAFYIFKRTLMHCDVDNHEHFAYLVEFVWEKLFKIADEMHQKHIKQDTP